jgi:hypothetical protein
MNRRVLKITAFFLLFVFSLSIGVSAAMPSTVEPRSNSYIYIAAASASASNGTVTISFDVTGTSKMTSIGASKIQIYKYGGTSPAYTFYSSSYPSMLGSNSIYYTSSVSYSGTSGTKYYAVVTFYAKNDNGSGTLTYTTKTVTA